MAYEIEEAKKLVVEAGKKLVETGLIARTWGNVSARISDTQFVITPSGRAYETLTPEEVVVVNIDDCTHEGDIKPSSEKGIHADAYKHHPLVNFVIHTHQKAATIVSITGMEIRNVYSEFRPILGDIVPVADYAMSTTNSLRKKVEACMMMNPSCNAFMLMHHGALCFGDSFEKAFEVADALEKCCEKVIKDNYLRHSWDKEYSDDAKRNYYLNKQDAGTMPD
ncbi:MAG: class II aldolase/adducin family protein, partial [Clostridiales bacterium]|nr:class II aldolase/adducin family protein [Clostridiales bacterium]